MKSERGLKLKLFTKMECFLFRFRRCCMGFTNPHSHSDTRKVRLFRELRWSREAYFVGSKIRQP